MDVQVILREGQPEYAVLPWAQYQALLKAAGQELARQVGISPHYLNMIEAGEREADSAIRRSLARALGVTGWSES